MVVRLLSIKRITSKLDRGQIKAQRTVMVFVASAKSTNIEGESSVPDEKRLRDNVWLRRPS